MRKGGPPENKIKYAQVKAPRWRVELPNDTDVGETENSLASTLNTHTARQREKPEECASDRTRREEEWGDSERAKKHRDGGGVK